MARIGSDWLGHGLGLARIGSVVGSDWLGLLRRGLSRPKAVDFESAPKYLSTSNEYVSTCQSKVGIINTCYIINSI